MKPDAEYDVVVIGARIAGATLAALLGDAGWRVLLVDRTSFPSSALSTHFFRGASLVAVLQRLEVLDEVLALGCPPLVRAYSYADGGDDPVVEPPQSPGEAGFCLSARREPLDHILVRRAARCATVDVMERTRFLGVVPENGRVAAARLMSTAGEARVRARLVVGADGRHSTVAKAVGAAAEFDDPPIRGVFHRYLRGFASRDGGLPDAAEFSDLGDELAYVFPSDDGVTCIALSVNLPDYTRMRHDVATAFDAKIARHRGLIERYQAATIDGKQLGCGPEPSWVRVPYGPGWALVGDAGMHQDPWTGHGMDCAGVHATFLAEAVLSWLDGSAGETEAMTRFHARRNEHALPLYRDTLVNGRDLSRSWIGA